ncbi:ABC-F family ATP-binding cassette domain-containing protein [Salicibibacter cibarius]|uniref:ABC-F family ATP-binding cassette domain-containing protein n=1 Tax=Salicibibacter cibarius TaxID=2743000 RepID=A0A7T6Z1I6_9BACI|nr:ABC-F family ATP-binding cassette domain-containing protein [Salicibibacter cibarius]QQK75241.1 ABC-F family ATP-binding cassette domain-containing protein [Salicibibacter cibarius]
MNILQCDRVTKSFGAETILQDIKMEIKSGDRVALVGRNGSGKTTLLNIITGDAPYDSGSVLMPKSQTMGFLAQDTGLESTRTIWEEMLTVFASLRSVENELRDLEAKMADPSVYDDPPSYEAVLKEYDEKQEYFRSSGGYHYEADIRSILSGLNFDRLSYDLPIASLSGGQKTRLALGKLLLTKPDLLVLDEPTNHLDIETLTWLENYLNSYEGAILIVSHDRYFLDRVVTKVYELAHTRTKLYHGNYSAFLENRAKDAELQQKAYDKQQAEIAQLETFVAKNIARASTTKRAQSKRKKLENMERVDAPLADAKSASIAFDIEQTSGNDVLAAKKVTFAYSGSDPLFRAVDFSVTRGENIAIIGPNGTGKTTFLKILGNRLAPTEGDVHYGSKVTVGYYDQEQAQLNATKTVLDELWDEHPQDVEKDIRTVLGRFLFSGEDVHKLVHSLSGGEKARLVLAKLMMKKANLLLFDEPTNHLDLDSKEVLEAALIDYPGTMVFISHDRYFLNRMSTRTVEFSGDDKLQTYLGNYDYYLEKKAEAEERAQLQETHAAAPVENKNKQSFKQEKEDKKIARKRRREIEAIENRISQLEEETETLQSSMLEPEVYEDYARANRTQADIDEKETELEQLMEQWEALQLDESQ